jgi:hypothetical protein
VPTVWSTVHIQTLAHVIGLVTLCRKCYVQIAFSWYRIFYMKSDMGVFSISECLVFSDQDMVFMFLVCARIMSPGHKISVFHPLEFGPCQHSYEHIYLILILNT